MLRLSLLSALLFMASADSIMRRLDDDMSWMTGYSILYENCFPTENLVAFRLCPESDSCTDGCSNSGEYLVDLAYFIDAFMEAQMSAREYRCEMIRENCDYDDEDTCYWEAGAGYCIDNEEDEFNVQEYIECTKVADGLYVGPYCGQDNYLIHLGVYADEDCSEFAEDGSFENAMGYSLPYGWYSQISLIGSECANCREHADGGDDDDEADVLEQCEELYSESVKCEEYLDVNYPDTSSCSYIESIKNKENISTLTTEKQARGRKTLIRFFLAAAVSAVLIGCYCIYQQRMTKLQPAKQNLM